MFQEDDPNLPLDAWVHLMRWLRRQRLCAHPVLFDCPMIRAGTRMAADNRHWTGPDLIEQFWWDTQVGNKELYPLHPQALKDTSVRLELLRDTDWAEQMGGWEHGIEARDQKIVRAHLEKIKVRGGGSAYSTGRWDLGAWDAMGPYAALDALEAYLLWRRQLQDLQDGQDGSLGPAVYNAGRWLGRERRKTKVLYRMMQRGLQFDTGKCLDAAAKVTEARDKVAADLPFEPTIERARDYWFGDGNNPTKLIPYDWTAGGTKGKPKPKLDQEIVGKMVVAQVPYAQTYDTWSKLNNSLSKWYLAYPQMTGSDGRLRTVFKQTQVRSGRTSVERVNTQAIPLDHAVQDRLPPDTATPGDCVTAKPGHQLWALDLAQAELRVGARWAPCPPMLELIQSGADTHGVTATELFGVHPGDPDWVMYRQVAKRSNFSLIFGVGTATFQATLSKFLGLVWSTERVDDLIKKWRRLYPQFGWAINRCAYAAKHNQYVKLKNGRLSWFDTQDFRTDPDAHKAFNRFVQASLAEMGAELMIWIEDTHPGVLVNWVHDAAYLEVPNDRAGPVVGEVSEYGAKLFEQMFQVPGGMDAHLVAAA